MVLQIFSAVAFVEAASAVGVVVAARTTQRRVRRADAAPLVHFFFLFNRPRRSHW